mmetsp:Transcript_403/g.227  ORF Transcript_403/g.227 Transcript_403/m.227 type:complete len:137 (+) Transcript_403:1393-1803(+)
MPPIIVFVNLKADVEILGAFLLKMGHSVTLLHGSKSQELREKGLNALKHGHAKILVCTNVAARGIDIEGVAHVINYSAPNNIVDYIHRIGRTGRAGNKGMASTLITPDTDQSFLVDLRKHFLENRQNIPNELENAV